MGQPLNHSLAGELFSFFEIGGPMIKRKLMGLSINGELTSGE